MMEGKKLNSLKAVMLARVSSKNQEEGHSLDAQGNQILDYASKHNIVIIKQFRIVESSTKGKRPEFKQMIDFIKASKEKLIVLAYNTDRLQRDFDEHYLELRDLIRQEKAEVHFTSTGNKMTAKDDSGTKFRNNLDIILANDYANRISDNVKRTNHEKRCKGTIAKDSPLGYLNLPRNKSVNPDPIVIIDKERSPFVIKAFEMYASGAYSVCDIVKILNKEGFTKKKGDGGVTKGIVSHMLVNRFYYGEEESKVYNTIYKHVYPPLISKELFDRCQEVRLSRGRALGKAREEESELQEFETIIDQTTKNTFIFKGTTRCKACNCIYSPELKTKRVIKPEIKSKGGFLKDKSNDDFYFTQEYTYLRPLKKGNGCKVCEHIREDYLDAQIENALKQIHIPESLLKALKPEVEKELAKNINYHKTRLFLTEEKLSKLKTQKENLLTLRLNGEITSEVFKEKDKVFTEEISNLEQEMEVLKVNTTRKDSIIDIFEIASKISEIYKSSDKLKKREIIKTVFTNFLLSGKNLYIYWRKPFNLLMEKEVKLNWLPVLNIIRTERREEVYNFYAITKFETVLKSL